MIPGIIPAMNNALIDCSVATPYRTKITLGGISIARVPAAATLAVERESAYLNLRISGRAILPMVAQVAGLEPQTAPNRPPATTKVMGQKGISVVAATSPLALKESAYKYRRQAERNRNPATKRWTTVITVLRKRVGNLSTSSMMAACPSLAAQWERARPMAKAVRNPVHS